MSKLPAVLKMMVLIAGLFGLAIADEPAPVPSR